MQRPSWSALAAGLIAVTVLAYAGVLRNGFVNFDSNHYVYENQVVRQGWTLDGVRWAFTTFRTANWHPVTWLSILFDVELFGLEPGAHHAVNVLLHALNGVLAMLVFGTLTGRRWPAALVGALIVLHPLHVESVAWAAQRKDVLSTLFLLLTSLAYVAHRRRPSVAKLGGALVLYALGLMTKPMLVTLPVLFVFLDIWPLGRRRETSLARIVLDKAPFGVLAGAASVVTLVAQSSEGAVGSLASFPFGARCANAAVSVVRYVGATLWPAELCVLYPFPDATPTWPWAGALVGIVAVSVAAFRLRRRAPYLLFGWSWFLVALIPVLGLVQVGRQALADRYTYVPHIGLFVALAWGLAALVERRPSTFRPVVGATALVLVALGLATRRQVATWRDSVTLYEHALRVTEDNATIEFNLGVTLSEAGRVDEGLWHVERAVRIDPAYPRGLYTLGVLYLNAGREDEARATFERALAIGDEDVDVLNNLAALAYGEGDREGYERAAHLWFRATVVAPDNPQVANNRIAALIALGSFENAVREAQLLVERWPGDLRAWTSLGRAQFELGAYGKASEAYRRAHELAPSDAALEGRLEESRARFRSEIE